MKRTNAIIKDLRKVRKGDHRAWIYNKDGSISKKVLIVDTIDIIKELKQYEVDYDECLAEEIEEYGWDHNNCENTYNFNANLTNNIQYFAMKDYVLMSFHIAGDVRGNYTDKIIYKFDFNAERDGVFGALIDSDCLRKYATYKGYHFDAFAFYSGVEVYDENFNYLTTSYECELKEIYKDIH